MSSSLSSLVDNLSEGYHSDKCKDCKSYLDYMSTKDDQCIFRCFECKKYYKKDFNKDLIKRFASIHNFCGEEINKFILLLRKGVYSYEYIDSWKRFDETLLLDKKEFYSSLNIEDITDVDYRHATGVSENFNNNKNIGDCHDLYVKVIHYYLQMYLKPLEVWVLKYMNSILFIFFFTRIIMTSCFKKDWSKIRTIDQY